MSDKRATLLATLRQAHFGAVAIAVCVAGLLLALIAFITLRTLVHDNLGLVARSIAYSSEAAVVFADSTTAEEILAQIGARERLVEAAIATADGQRFAHYGAGADDPMDRLGATLGRWIFPSPVQADIVYEQRVIGSVALRGNGLVFAGFFLKTLGVAALSLWLAVLAAGHVARRTERRIVHKLDAFAALTRSLRLSEDFARRLPTFDVLEFDELGKDFNALLAQLETNRAELQARQERLEEANASLSHLALHDSLTGLANRPHFDEALRRALKKAREEQGRIGLLYLDNDRFKQINDRFGHAAGDALLVAVAKRIRGAIRDSDLVARLGGDEFAVLLAPLRSDDDAVVVAQKVLTAMSQPVAIAEGEWIAPGISIGIAFYPTHGESCEQLLRAADDAMYLAKKGGRGCYQVFDPVLVEQTASAPDAGTVADIERA